MGYEGQTPVLKLVGSGEGGIEEMAEDLNSSKIQYAYCRVLDSNTNLPKYVLINWQGEAAPESMKFKCTSHLRDVAAFVRGVHVTVNARTEDDVDPDDIAQKVAKASGANYSIHQEKPKAPPPNQQRMPKRRIHLGLWARFIREQLQPRTSTIESETNSGPKLRKRNKGELRKKDRGE